MIRRVEDVLNGAQNLRQGLRGQLRRSTGAGRERRQAENVVTGHACILFDRKIRSEYARLLAALQQAGRISFTRPAA